MTESSYAVEIKNLEIRYKTLDGVVNAANGIDLTIKRGKTLGLMDETGAGKTTMVLSILRLVSDPPGKIIGGSITLEGKDIPSYSEKEMETIRGDKVSMIFQNSVTSLNPVATVEEQIAEVIQPHENTDKKASMTKAKEMLKLAGIPGNRNGEYPHQFSGGMKQRVTIAMVLVCNPHLLIVDGLTAALDVTIQAQVLDLMQKLREKYGTSMLVITHDLGIVAEVCGEMSTTYAGHIVEHGTLEDIFSHTNHPYTKGLFGPLPDVEKRSEELKLTPGLMPDLTNLPSGCPFHPRYRYCQDICKSRTPGGTGLSDIHTVSCLAYGEGIEVTLRGDNS